MKILLLLIVPALLFASCEKCYTCQQTTNVPGSHESTNVEFCGSKKEKEQFEQKYRTMGAGNPYGTWMECVSK